MEENNAEPKPRQFINVWGAREHNLKNIDVTIPRNSLTVITGLSGSGKSSLAFDTLFAEGQRRYIETFPAYARNFLSDLKRPDVDKITGLSPVICIEQKTTNRNPRSTVGTTTEIFDFLRLLFAKAAKAYSYETGEEMIRYSDQQILEQIQHEFLGHNTIILAPLITGRKGHYRELFDNLRRKGFLNCMADGNIIPLTEGLKLDRYKKHDIAVVIDRLNICEKNNERINRSLQTAMKAGDGLVLLIDQTNNSQKFFSKRLVCPTTGIAYRDPAPNNFSFNSPQGACHRCKGLGLVADIDLDKIIPNKKLSIYNGAIAPLGKYRNLLIFWQIDEVLRKYGCDLRSPINDIPDDAIGEVLYGSLEKVRINRELLHTSSDYFTDFEGIVKYIKGIINKDDSPAAQKWAAQFLSMKECPDCHGKRLNKEALAFKIADKNIAQLAEIDIQQLHDWTKQIPTLLEPKQKIIADEILREISKRTGFLISVGLGYLSLNRQAATLSGGESQRIRLATQIGAQLVNVLYILDEPSIGLHQKDNQKLIDALKKLRDAGNTIIVVEHDRDMMLNADYIVDIGPQAGNKGGEVVFQGPPNLMINSNSITAQWLADKKNIKLPSKRRKGNGKFICLTGAKGNNLKNIDLKLPLGCLTVVTGVSGSGKSSLINQTLLPILTKHLYRTLDNPLPYDSIDGLQFIDKAVDVDQSPIGKTPRSNPATYTGLFANIRELFASLPEAKARGYKPGRFSFNVKGGRCEKCNGNGYKVLEMNFLPDVTVPCHECNGKRYNRETLQVKLKGKSIADVLNMTVEQAADFFDNQPDILRKILTLKEVGLGYIKLGQPSSTLSGGENQRVKLAAELARKDTGNTIFVLDEPTTGLHFEDIKTLMDLINKLVDKGNSVIIIEHNLDVIKLADYIIDLGPEGGEKGGSIVAQGTPEQIALNNIGHTANFLNKTLLKQ